MFIVKYRKIFYGLSILLIAISVFSFWKFGVSVGIDFTGGNLLEVTYPDGRPEKDLISESIKNAKFDNVLVQPVGENGFSIKTQEINAEQKESLKKAVSLQGEVKIVEEKNTTIGPSAGEELVTKAYIAIIVVVALIVLFVTFAFRKVSEPVQSWKYGLATIIALGHDIVLPFGAFVIYSYYFGGQIDMLFVSALLAILGFSVHDTIVVFDRIRESLRLQKENRENDSFENIVGKSVTQTMGRSINTSLTTFIVLITFYILGPESTKHFTFTLMAGIIAGTYSSVFIASPILVTFNKLFKRK
jgi:preprotein translocase subunit SecF